MIDDIKFMNSVTLARVWRAGNQQTLTEKEDVSILEICTSLNRYLDTMEFQPCKVPLRTSSILINGAAELYNIEVNNLLRECYELDMEMAIRKTRMVNLDTGSNEGCNVLNVALEPLLLPISNQDHNEEYSRTKSICESISSSRKRRQTTSNNLRNEKRTCSAFAMEPPEEADQSIRDVLPNQEYADGNDEMLIELDVPFFEKNEQTHEKGIQANMSYINSRQRNTNNGTFNEHLPFGFVMVYDNYNDRVPSKIIYSSLNSSVKNL